MKTGRQSAEHYDGHINKHKIRFSLLLITTFQPWETLWGQSGSLYLFHRLGIQVCKVFKDPPPSTPPQEKKRKKPKLDLRSCNSWFLNILWITVTIPLLLSQLFSFTMLTVPQRQSRCFVATCLFGGRLPWQSWRWAFTDFTAQVLCHHVCHREACRKSVLIADSTSRTPLPIIPPPPRSQFCTEPRTPPSYLFQEPVLSSHGKTLPEITLKPLVLTVP